MDVLTTRPLPLAEWLSVIEREYLSGFVPAGGASVKLAILDDAALGPAADRLIGLGRQCAMLTVPVDAGLTRVHLMHELFFAIARALPWDGLVQRYLEGLFAANAYPWPRPGAAMTMPELAAAFAVAPSLLARQRDQWLTADLWDDRRLAQDFRAALLRLCLARLEPDGGEMAGPVLQWLRGDMVLPAPYGPRRRMWQVVVADEAQRIKNAHTAISATLKALPGQRAWALTGTPLENRPDDAASILDFVAPGLHDPATLVAVSAAPCPWCSSAAAAPPCCRTSRPRRCSSCRRTCCPPSVPPTTPRIARAWCGCARWARSCG